MIKLKIKKAALILKNQGLDVLVYRVLEKRIAQKQKLSVNSKHAIPKISLISGEEFLSVDFIQKPYIPLLKKRETKIISWVMPQPASGGGHQNIFRFIEYLEKAGYTNIIYIIGNPQDLSTEAAEAAVSQYCSAQKMTFHIYDKDTVDANVDAIFATSWETAYHVFNIETEALKYYFVQDFEPLFFPVGTRYILAENTYRFGFKGITAGNWLKKKLEVDYKMNCESYDFGADKKLYHITNTEKRDGVFFYTRPSTERRGFELGIMALSLFHREYPDVTIHFAGEDVSQYGIPFPYINHKTLKLSELNSIYNQCATALVISLTNMSLLPLELLASGTVPVVNEGNNNQLVSDNSFICYTVSTPVEIANNLKHSFLENNHSQLAERLNNSVVDGAWDVAGEKLVKILGDDLHA